ncbi:MAG: chorismate synthase [Flavobacterium sp.]|nr:chorismate synthase [Flavobacterium sp.]
MIRFLTAGESHGKALNVIVDGFPSNLSLDEKYINEQLRRRQSGYGRGLRMKIETDTAEIISGVRFAKTSGAPISIIIRNRDWDNWQGLMDVNENKIKHEKISIPRPGHADLAGVSKYNLDDIRNSIERSSARETASRVASGAVAKKFLSQFGIEVGSFVESIGGIYSKNNFTDKLFANDPGKKFSGNYLSKLADLSQVRVLDNNQEEKIIRKIKIAKKKGDTLGGTFIVVTTGVPVGLGSFMQYDRRLDADLAQAVISINAVKGVEIGNAFEGAGFFGSEIHDEIIIKGKNLSRKTNNYGGIEGGISNGLPIIVRGAMKPIATLMSPIETVELVTMKKVLARRERSDFVAVPACAVIGEAMAAWVIAKHFIEKFGGDSIEETLDNYKSYLSKLHTRIKTNFSK